MALATKYLTAAAERRKKHGKKEGKGLSRSQMSLFCQAAGPNTKGCDKKTMDKKVVTNARGEGVDAGGKTRKQILGGELRRYNTEENDGKAQRATRVASYD